MLSLIAGRGDLFDSAASMLPDTGEGGRGAGRAASRKKVPPAPLSLGKEKGASICRGKKEKEKSFAYGKTMMVPS